jgi:hypothetical protein
MPTNTLTDNQCRSDKPVDGKARKLFDGHGLHLNVPPPGAKVWRVACRTAGKPQTATLGPYPLQSLADAHSRRDELCRKLLDGFHVKARPAKSITFADACGQHWGGRKDVSPSYLLTVTKNTITDLLISRPPPLYGPVRPDRCHLACA